MKHCYYTCPRQPTLEAKRPKKGQQMTYQLIRGERRLINILKIRGVGKDDKPQYRRIPRFQARGLVDSGEYKYVSNQEYRKATAKPESAPTAPKEGRKTKKSKLTRKERRELAEQEESESKQKDYSKKLERDQKRRNKRRGEGKAKRDKIRSDRKRRRGSGRNKDGED